MIKPRKIKFSDKKATKKYQIKDNGIGIAKSHQSKVFNMFQKLHNNEEYSGSGIGLSHCKKIVNLMDGEIWMDSTPDVGTSVFFTYLKRQN